jgi:signal peptidase I
MNRRWQRLRLNARRLVFVALVVAWAIFLRPTSLGGSATYVLVRGDSMLPTYENGDFLVAYGNDSYRVGDVVAYRVPEGDVGAGHLIVHRISAASDAGYTLTGDNNPASDPWLIGRSNIAGHVVTRVPAVGLFLAFVLQPVVAGGIAASLVVMYGVAGWFGTATQKPKASGLDPAQARRRLSPRALSLSSAAHGARRGK